MKFALLGNDPQAIRLAKEVARGPHEIVWIGQQGPQQGSSTAELLALAPGAVVDDVQWESLLSGQVADAVILGRDADESRLREQFRLLTQSAVPLVVSHPVSVDVLLYYEIEMIRQESRGVLRPVVLGDRHPALKSVNAVCAPRSGDERPPRDGIGQVEQFLVQRSLARRDRESVLESLARDAFLIAQVCGRVVQVNATGGGPSHPSEADVAGRIADDALSGLGVQLTTDCGIVVRWSVVPSRGEEGAVWTLHGTSGTMTLETYDLRDWRIAGNFGGESTERVFDDFDAERIAIEQAAAAIQNDDDGDAWRWATRSLEVVDGAEFSLRRGRTIDLFDQRPSEASTFKGIMSAAGCGILLLGFFMSVAIAVIGGVFQSAVLRYWYIPLLIVMLVFLLLQFLPAIMSDSNRRDGD